MTDKSLRELAYRVEALDGPDREIDCLIAVQALGFITQPNKGWPEKTDYGYVDGDGGKVWPGNGGDLLVPRFTASLDAAMTLVPEGWWHKIMGPRKYLNIPDSSPNFWSAEVESWETNSGGRGWGATSALAVLAAALRAQEMNNGQ